MEDEKSKGREKGRRDEKGKRKRRGQQYLTVLVTGASVTVSVFTIVVLKVSVVDASTGTSVEVIVSVIVAVTMGVLAV